MRTNGEGVGAPARWGPLARFGAFAVVSITLIAGLASIMPLAPSGPPSNTTAAGDDTAIPVPWSQEMVMRFSPPAVNFRDPTSVLITDATYRSRHGEAYVCGYYNAKNGFGAYVGPRPFVNGANPKRLSFKALWRWACETTDASEATKARYGHIATQGEIEAQFKLAPGETVRVVNLSKHGGGGVSIVCGRASINRAKPIRFISTAGVLSREDNPPGNGNFPGGGSPSERAYEWKFTWQTLCVEE